MSGKLLQISIKTAVITAAVILLYEISDFLLIYHYFSFEYYIAGVAVIALITGVVLSRGYHQLKITATKSAPLTVLTNRELQVLAMISEGKSNKEIAAGNFVEVSTIKTHINNIYFKLKVKNRKEAIEIYRLSYFNTKSTFSPPAIS